MRYSWRRALSLDSIDGCTHNPKADGSNPILAPGETSQFRPSLPSDSDAVLQDILDSRHQFCTETALV
jgi:hypothetical protein